MLKQLNEAIAYIEKNLQGNIDFNKAASRVGVSKDEFMRFFRCMTGMTLNEYVRRRRMTLAADDLRFSYDRVIDIAIRYHYETVEGFSKAFVRQHGITPQAYRKFGGSLTIYPPVSFYLTIKGGKELDYRLVEISETKVYGISRQFEGKKYKSREELRYKMWSDDGDFVPGEICEGTWNEANIGSFDGIWYGVWQDGRYMIGREKAFVKNESMETRVLPAGTYVAFKSKRGIPAWQAFPQMFEMIFECWLPSSGYKKKSDLILEVLHLRANREVRRKERYYEVWIPVERINSKM